MNEQNGGDGQTLGTGGGQQESGAGYGNAQQGVDVQQGGGMDSSGGTGSDGGPTSGALTGAEAGGVHEADQAVQRSETIEAEDIEFEADDDLIDDDD